jgi:hypothetical protein
MDHEVKELVQEDYITALEDVVINGFELGMTLDQIHKDINDAACEYAEDALALRRRLQKRHHA